MYVYYIYVYIIYYIHIISMYIYYLYIHGEKNLDYLKAKIFDKASEKKRNICTFK